MKILTRLASLAAFLLAGAISAQAQISTPPAGPWRLGIGIESGIPTGDLSGISHFDLGGTARLQYDFNSSFSLMLTSGYYNFFAKENVFINSANAGTVHVNVDMLPVKAGAKLFFAGSLYADGEIGAGFETTEAKQTSWSFHRD